MPNKSQRRLTSGSKNYRAGELSLFPNSIDNKVSLFEAVNNAETTISHNVTPSSKYLILNDASKFPENGLVRLESVDSSGRFEIIFYSKKIGNQLHLLQRGYNKSNEGHWPIGSIIKCPVMAEHHNAVKDAILKIQAKLGINDNPHKDSIHGQLKALEQKWLSPKVIFKAFPKNGPEPLTVKFQNFSTGYGLKYLWDFGDASTSTESSPSHVYGEAGSYDVILHVVSLSGASAYAEKKNYIQVNNEQKRPFFYVKPKNGYSAHFSAKESTSTEFTFVDQTDGNILERHWFFGDGEDVTVNKPNIHTIKHVYKAPGTYYPVLLIRYKNNKLTKTKLSEGIKVE